jgi:carbon-monoxide dehydrogenase iron sulfur subunit
MAKILYIDPSKCTGCRTCEIVCSIKNEGMVNPVLSRIRMVADKYRGLRIPMVCQQCQDAICVSVCPVGALWRDNELGVVKLNEDRCIGCKVCVIACPFGGVVINPLSGRIFKCELCDGDPECVRFCDDKAITYVEPDAMLMEMRRQVVEDLSPLFEKYSGQERTVHMVGTE